MIKKAVDLDPANGAYLDSLGWAYYKLGKYELAEDTLIKASQRIGTDPTVQDHLGRSVSEDRALEAGGGALGAGAAGVEQDRRCGSGSE